MGAFGPGRLRCVDARFVLPQPPASARVLGNHPGWREGLIAAGVEVVEDRGRRVDLVVTSPGHLDKVPDDPAMIVVTGRGGRRQLRRRGYAVEAMLVLHGRAGPRTIVPLGRGPRLIAAALSGAAVSRRRARLVRVAAALRVVPDRWCVTVAARSPGPPYPVAEALESLDLPDDPDWWCWFGTTIFDEERGCFLLAPRRSARPAWVLKFSRTGEDADRFAREEEMLALAASLPGDLSSHAPRLVGRISSDATQASVETAAPGRPITRVLPPHGSAERALACAETIAAWITSVGAATLVPPDRMQPERDRLAREVLGAWPGPSIPGDVIAGIGGVGGVLAHNDIGSDNTSVDDAGFIIIDWESARFPALPLWDLFHFAATVLQFLPADGEPLQRVQAAFRGESIYSDHLFRWTQAAVAAAQVPPDAVGPIATLCWLERRLSIGPDFDPREHGVPYLLADPWLRDPALGLDWRAWR